MGLPLTGRPRGPAASWCQLRLVVELALEAQHWGPLSTTAGLSPTPQRARAPSRCRRQTAEVLFLLTFYVPLATILRTFGHHSAYLWPPFCVPLATIFGEFPALSEPNSGCKLRQCVYWCLRCSLCQSPASHSVMALARLPRTRDAVVDSIVRSCTPPPASTWNPAGHLAAVQ